MFRYGFWGIGAFLKLTPCEQITEKIGELFTCSDLNGYIRIRTPFLYPDGDVIDLFYPDFHTRLPQRSALVIVLSTGSRTEARRLAAFTSATWHDLNYLTSGPEALKFISLFDDTLDVWTEEDYRLVEDISEVANWSRPDEFLEELAS